MLPLLLTVSLVVGTRTQIDYYRCQGLATAAAGFVASSGIQIAAATRSCGLEDDACAFDIEIAVASLARAAVLGTGAGEACGGPSNPCAMSVTKATSFLSTAAAAGTQAAIRVRRKQFDRARREIASMGTLLRDAGRAVTGAAAFCQPMSDNSNQSQPPKPNYLGFCVSDSMRAATAVAAAGVAIRGAVEDCSSHRAACVRHVAFIVSMLSKTAEDSATTARSCRAAGNPHCTALASDVVVNLAAAVGEGAGIKMDMDKDDQGAAISSLARMAGSLQATAQRLGKAINQCEHPGEPINPQETNVALCIGDVVSGATFVANIGWEISMVVNDCTKNNTQDVLGQAICSTDITFLLSISAHATNQIMFATEDCQYGQAFNTICGSSIALSVESLAEAALFASLAAFYAVTPDTVDGLTPNLNAIGKSVSEMSVSLGQFGSTLSRAVRTCALQAVGVESENREPTDARNFQGPWESDKLGEPRHGRLPVFLRDWAMQMLHASRKKSHNLIFEFGILATGISAAVLVPIFRRRTVSQGVTSNDDDDDAVVEPCINNADKESQLVTDDSQLCFSGP